MTQKVTTSSITEKVKSLLGSSILTAQNTTQQSPGNESLSSTRTLRSSNQGSSSKDGNKLFSNAFNIPKDVQKQMNGKKQKEDQARKKIDKELSYFEQMKSKILAEKREEDREKYRPKEKPKTTDNHKKNQDKKIGQSPNINFRRIITQEEEQKQKIRLRQSQSSDKESKKPDSMSKTAQVKQGKVPQKQTKQDKRNQQTKKHQKVFSKKLPKPLQVQKTQAEQKSLQQKILPSSSVKISSSLKQSSQQQQFNKPPSNSRSSQTKVSSSNTTAQAKKQSLSAIKSINSKGLMKQSQLLNRKVYEMKQNKSIHDYILSKNYILEGQNKFEEQKKIYNSPGNKGGQALSKQMQLLSQFIYEDQEYVFTITRGKVPNKTQKFIDIQIHPVNISALGQQKIKEESEPKQQVGKKWRLRGQVYGNKDKQEQNRITPQQDQRQSRYLISQNAEHMTRSGSHQASALNVYTYYRCTLTNSKLPFNIRKYCTNISILYSKLEKFKKSLALLPKFNKLEVSFINQNQKKFRYDEYNDRDEEETVKLRLNAEKYTLPIENGNRNCVDQNQGNFSFWNQFQSSEQKTRKRNQLLQKQIKNLRQSLNEQKTDNQRLTMMYQRQKQTKQNFYKQLREMKQVRQISNTPINSTQGATVSKPMSSAINLSIPSSPQLHPESSSGSLPQLSSLNIQSLQIPASSRVNSNSSNALKNQKLILMQHPVVEILQIDDDSGSPVLEDIQSYNKSSSGQDSYYKQKNKRESKDPYYDESKGKRGRTKKSKPPGPQLSLYQHQNNQPGKFVHTVNGRSLSAAQILAYNSNQSDLKSFLNQDQDFICNAKSYLNPANSNTSYLSSNRGINNNRYRQRVSGSSQYGDRKQIWQQYAGKTGNQALKTIVDQESQFTQSRNLVKTGVKLNTMGFMQLFFNVLQLDLSDNRIKQIQGLYNIRKLRRLQLNKNQISKIGGLQQNRQLKELYLRQNKISRIQNVFHLKKLQSFSLQTNLIEKIPDQISELISLKIFHLNFNSIQKLPNAFLIMNNLKAIRISDNPKLNLTTDSLNRIIMEQLEQKKVSIYSKGNFD